MGQFVKGDIVVVPFPFSDLTANKKRPALVVATLTGDDVILCQITSKATRDDYAIGLSGADLGSGILHQDSNIRPNRLFTADSRIILYKAASLNSSKLEEVLAKIVEIVKA